MSFRFCQNVELNVIESHQNMHDNQIIVSHVFFSANGLLKKMSMYGIFQIRAKSAKFIETASGKNGTCNSTSVLARYNQLKR